MILLSAPSAEALGGRRQRQGDGEENMGAARAEACGGGLYNARQIPDRRGQHQHDEWQIDMRHSNHHAGEIGDQLHRMADEPEFYEEVVDETVIDEKRNPAERSDDEIEHRREDNQERERNSPALWARGCKISQRITKHETRECDGEGESRVRQIASR
jgi:hypothetical protein